jgi:pyruvate-formate lyase-activating enzyme
MYTVTNSEVTERFPDQWLVITPVAVETIPFVHAWPNAKALQISTVGCNLTCPGCVSEVLVRSPDTMGTGLKHRSPLSIIEEAEQEQCQGIIFCLNEPTVSLPSFLRVAHLAKERGMFVGCSTNGYFSDHTLNLLIPVLDMVNIGLKGTNPDVLRSCGIRDRGIVMENISRLNAAGVHVEAALMHATGQEEDLIQQAREVMAISDTIPVQIMRCMAFGELGEDSEPAIPDSERLCDHIRTFVPHVYLFNSPGSSYLNSVCTSCGGVLISREMYGPMGCRPLNSAGNGVCSCGYHLPVIGTIQQTRYEEEGMKGGYRPTRALEFIQGIVSCLGEEDPACAPHLWQSFMAGDGLNRIHDRIQRIPSYYGIIQEVADIIGRKEVGEDLISTLQGMVHRVSDAVEGAQRPRVLYSMGYPNFMINGGRFENHLVETAGGEPVNQLISRTGKPGVTISYDEFALLNPDWICISGLFSLPKESCLQYCNKHNLTSPAVTDNNIIEMPASWDFGSPRWILGLMLLAAMFHPDRCTWNLKDEVDRFYRRFYGISFDSVHPTRSFIKASAR